jgi:predicted ATPase
VPFFIEELVKSLRETGAIEQRDWKWMLTRAAADLSVPDTVEELLTARIDRLPESAKRILQIGSVIGREFGWELLKAVADLPELELIGHLSALKDAELIYERGVHPRTVYTVASGSSWAGSGPGRCPSLAVTSRGRATDGGPPRELLISPTLSPCLRRDGCWPTSV